jgi:hypothetical protein
VPESLKGGTAIASNNRTNGTLAEECFEVQLYDKFRNQYEQSGISGVLGATTRSASETTSVYELIGNTSAVSSDSGKLSWCGVMTSKIAANVSFHVIVFNTSFIVSGPHSVNASGKVAGVILSAPVPPNVSVVPGGTLPILKISFVDAGGNAVVFKPSTFVRVRIFSRRPVNGRRLLSDADLQEETSDDCPNGGPNLVPISTSVNISVNTSVFACKAGASIVRYDIVSDDNGIITVISGGPPLLSFDIIVQSGPAVVFYLKNAKDTPSMSFSKLVNVTLVVFQDAGRNVFPPLPLPLPIPSHMPFSPPPYFSRHFFNIHVVSGHQLTMSFRMSR